MDNKQAQFILESYRPHGQDAHDPQFAEPLNCAARDPELAAWFAEERELDAALGRKLKELPVPVALRDELLAGNPSPPLRPVRRRYAMLSLAAALAFLAVATVLWFRPTQEAARFSDFRREMLATVSSVLTLDFAHEDLSEIQKWLASHASVTGYQLPAGLQRLPGRGCRTLTWNSQPVVLICFRLEGNQTVHLFVASRTAMPDPPSGEQGQFARQGKWVTAGWCKDDKVYIMAGLGDEASLLPYL
jgi:hypothetical protein